MGKARLLAVIAAVVLLTAAPAEADHMNGHYTDNRGIQIDLRQAGKTVTGAVLEPSGQRTTLNGRTDGNYASGQVVGAHQGTFELKYVQGNPPSVQIIVYDVYGNVFDSAVYQRVGAPPSSAGGYDGGHDHSQGQGQHDAYEQGQGQGQQQQQQSGAGSEQGGSGSSLPVVD